MDDAERSAATLRETHQRRLHPSMKASSLRKELEALMSEESRRADTFSKSLDTFEAQSKVTSASKLFALCLSPSVFCLSVGIERSPDSSR